MLARPHIIRLTPRFRAAASDIPEGWSRLETAQGVKEVTDVKGGFVYFDIFVDVTLSFAVPEATGTGSYNVSMFVSADGEDGQIVSFPVTVE